MLTRTRISKALDVGRLGAAICRPGMDTRIWVSLAVAKADSMVMDDGVFVDVTLVPSGEEITARVGADYEGPGFGFYSKIKKDDDLVVAIPSGDSSIGSVVIKRLWSAADAPPDKADTYKDDVVLVIEKDKNIRITVSGGGTVCLGDFDPAEFVALADKVKSEFQKVADHQALLENIINGSVSPQPPNAPDVLWVALKAALVGQLYPTPGSVAAETVKAK